MDPWSVLTSHQAPLARAFLVDREAERKHLVIYLSGAHAYGFPSPDSDLDLKCVHIAPTRSLVGLSPPDDPPGRIDVVDGVELDYGSNELGGVLRGILKGNGNYIERIFGQLVLGGDHVTLDSAREALAPVISRRVGKHYGGFATSQLRAFDEKPTAKRALYVLRTAATGLHLLLTGKVVTDIAELGEHLPTEIGELVTIKQRGEKQPLESDHARAWRGRLAAAIDAIDAAWPRSVLPAEPPPDAILAVDEWLRDVRQKSW